jgi:hypothetical protein
LRSPIGVLMVIFQFPSTAISGLPCLSRQTGMVWASLDARYSASSVEAQSGF